MTIGCCCSATRGCCRSRRPSIGTGCRGRIIDDGDLDVRDRWAAPSTPAAGIVTEALDQISSSSTLRAGRLLAPLGIRYIVIPEFDGVNSTTDEPIAIADGLAAALDDQLDLSSVTGGFPTLEIYENGAWLPTVSLLGGATAAASQTAGTEALLRADLTDAAPIMPGADQFDVATADVTAGVVQLGVPYDPNWVLTRRRRRHRRPADRSASAPPSTSPRRASPSSGTTRRPSGRCSSDSRSRCGPERSSSH